MKSSTYWKKRFEQLENSLHKKAIDVYNETQKTFETAQKEIEKEIASWYQRIADNNEITITEAKKLLKDSELKEFKWTVDDYIKYGKENAINQQWMKELENASAKYHISRLETLKINTRQTVESLYQKEYETIGDMAKSIYTDGFYRTNYEISKGLNVGFNVSKIDNNKLEKILSKPWASDGKNFSDRIWQSKTQLVNELQNELTRMCVLGKKPDDVINSLAKKLNVSKTQAGRLIMTESAYFSSLSQKDSFNNLGVEKFEVVATLDEKTSAICQSMDGQVFDMKDFECGVTAPPFHPNCRSTTVPAFDDEFDIGERAARDPETGKTVYVPSNIKYSEWKEKYVISGLGAKSKNTYENHPKPKLLEVITDLSIKNIENVLNKYENTIKNSKIENAIVITQEGKIYQCYGNEFNVWPDKDLEKELYNAYVTHNHLTEKTSYSFSNADIKLFKKYKLKILRGIDDKYTYELNSNKTSILNMPTIDEIIEDNSLEHMLSIEYSIENDILYKRWKND